MNSNRRYIAGIRMTLRSPQRRQRTLLRWLASAALLASAPIADAAQPQGDRATDAEITTAVEDALLYDTGVAGHRLGVKTHEGIVTLFGTAGDLQAKERAAKIAGHVRGVRSVINQIALDTEERPDEELARDVEQALLFDAATDAYQLDARADDGKVTLTGTVGSYQEKQIALHVVKGVRGVQEVADEIEVQYDTTRADTEIAAEIERALEIDTWVTAPLINVGVERGAVTLTGSVSSVAEKERALAAAWVAGVSSVNAKGLDIQPWEDPEIGTAKSPARPDEQIADAVRDALRRDPRVQSFMPAVRVAQGAVILSGTVDNVRAQKAAAQDARNTVGVRRVFNHIRVEPAEEFPDEQVERNVTAALTRNTITEAYEIEVEVDRGVATLAGTVDTYREKSEAEKVAQSANGVVSVRNRIEVSFPSYTYYDYDLDPYLNYDPFYYDEHLATHHRPPVLSTWPYTSDAEVKDDIEDELFWSPFVDEDEIEVAVESGVATLSGRVDSWSEFRAATENAYEGGARHVVNNLTIQ